MPQMTDTERYLLEAVARRAATMQRYIHIALERDVYIDKVFGLMALNVIRTLMVLCGDGIAKNFLLWLTHSLRDDEGLCICGKLKPLENIVCGACHAEFEADDRELEVLEQMDKPSQGEVS